MRPSRTVLLVWSLIIVGLVLLEVGELTRFYTIPVQQALGDPIVFVFSLVFTTIVAMIGAIFVGIYISHRLLSPSGFSPFEEEMLAMRAELRDVRESVEAIRARVEGPARPPPSTPPELPR